LHNWEQFPGKTRSRDTAYTGGGSPNHTWGPGKGPLQPRGDTFLGKKKETVPEHFLRGALKIREAIQGRFPKENGGEISVGGKYL